MIEDSYKLKGLRKQLVRELEEKGIKDTAVLEAINKVPRHFFFEKTFINFAYEDKAFPIGADQTISQPYTVAYQSQLLEIQKRDKVLEIGTGSGYQAAILAEMGAKVYSVERQQKLFFKSKTLLSKLKYASISCFLGDGSLGLSQHAPFDKIIATAGAPQVPENLISQLKIGGIMVIPVGNEESQKMIRLVKEAKNRFNTIELDTFKFVPLIGKNAWNSDR